VVICFPSLGVFAELPDEMSSEMVDAFDNIPNACVAGAPAKMPAAVGAKVIEDKAETLRRMIDGPANFRDEPSGKVIGSFPKGLFVQIRAQKGDWFLVVGYWDCDAGSGWTHKKNLVYLTRAQISERDTKFMGIKEEAKELNTAAFKAFLFESKPKIAAEKAERAFELTSKCEVALGFDDCVTIRHLSALIRAQIALKEEKFAKAEEFLLKALDLPPGRSFESLGPNLTVAQLFLVAGRRESVIRYLEKSKKVWKKSARMHDKGEGYSTVDTPSTLPDLWISEIRSGKNPELKIPGLNGGSHNAVYWNKSYYSE
jgi:hypothetical protein